MSVASPTTDWIGFPCPGSSPTWRYYSDGSIEVNGEGIVATPLPANVARWLPLILTSSANWGVPPTQIAAIMSVESTGKTGYPGGLMQLETATANDMAKLNPRYSGSVPLSPATITNDDAMNIDLGTQYLAQGLNHYRNDIVQAGAWYNAGGVKCGTGHIMHTSTPCLPTTWNIIMGCVNNTVKPDYPRNLIRYLNGAIAAGFGQDFVPSRTAPSGEVVASMVGAPTLVAVGGFAAAVGFFVAKKFKI